MSILNYADYSQLKLGVNCLPNVVRGIADSIDGRTTAEPYSTDAEADAAFAADDQAAEVAELATDDQGEPEQGSAADHWASTANVRRSTHGHRSRSSATGEPRQVPEP